MNAGRDRIKAVKQATANAKSSNVPWSIWMDGSGCYWVSNLTTYSGFSNVEQAILPDGTVLSGDEFRRMKVIYSHVDPCVRFQIGLAEELTGKQMKYIRDEIKNEDAVLSVDFDVRMVIVVVGNIKDSHVREKKFKKIVTDTVERGYSC